MIPENLNEWNPELIKKLIEIGYEEDQKVEYKRVLEEQDRKKEYKQKIEEIFCSFANSSGGFIIFGLDDDRSLIGIKVPTDQEINLKINQIHSNSIPDILSEAKKINVDGKDLIIVKIHENLDKPVQCSNGSFHIRVSGESLPISRDNLSNWFISKELKKQKYEKLMFEISWIEKVIKEQDKLASSKTLPPFYKLRIKELQDALSDFYGYFKENAQETINNLNNIFGEIEKEKTFLEIKTSVELRKKYQHSWHDLSSFLNYSAASYLDTNFKLYSSFQSLEHQLNKLKEFI